VVADGVVHAVATDTRPSETIEEQTERALQELDDLLCKAGSGKSGLVQATVYLSDISLKPRMDRVWCDWVGPEENWPQRACIGVALDEGYLIEIVVTAKCFDTAG
jgi:enamine deaminase RidA (YjgF/YER057c/UK114 family)